METAPSEAILDEARVHLEKALEIDPEFARARLALAKLHNEEGRQAEAVQLLHEAIDSRPTLSDARLLLAEILLQEDQEAEAIQQLQAVADIDTNDHVSRRQLANILIAKGDTKKAANLLSRVVDLAPLDGNAHLQLAVLLEHPDDVERARLLLEIAADLLPDDPRPPYQMALLLLRGEYTDEEGNLIVAPNAEAAQKHLQATVRLDPHHGPAHLQLGQIRHGEKDFRAARRHYRHASEDPRSVGYANLQLAKLAEKEGKPKDIRPLLDKAVKQSDSCGDALLERAAYFLREEKGPEAEKDLKAAEKTFAATELALSKASDEASAMANFARARRLQEKALVARRAKGPAWLSLGQIRLSKGKEKDAVSFLERALQANPGLYEARFTLAALLEGTDRDEETLAHLEAVLEANWSHVEAHFRLGERALKNKDLQKANMHFLIVTDLVPNHKAAKQRLRKLTKK